MSKVELREDPFGCVKGILWSLVIELGLALLVAIGIILYVVLR